MALILPDWLQEVPDGWDRNRAVGKFYIRVAGIYNCPRGGIIELANSLNINYTTLKSQMNDKNQRGAHAETLRRLNGLLGPDFVPPEILERFW